MEKTIVDIVERWERTGNISAEELSSIEALKETDRRSYREIRPILFLMRADAGVDDNGAPTSSSDHLIDVSDNVMEQIESEPNPFQRRRGRFQPVVAVAALALLAVASVIGVMRIGMVGDEPQRIIVQFTLSAPEADSVALVGDFNGWEPDAYELSDADGDGVWEIEVELEQNQVYTYNFLIDETEWISDPSSKQRVEDSFGGEKSVLNL